MRSLLRARLFGSVCTIPDCGVYTGQGGRFADAGSSAVPHACGVQTPALGGIAAGRRDGWGARAVDQPTWRGDPPGPQACI